MFALPLFHITWELKVEDLIKKVMPEPAQGLVVKPTWLGDIAACDPRLAWTLREMGAAPGGYVDTGGWEMIPISASWTAVAANQTVAGDTQGIVESELWVMSVDYAVERPEAFAGNILKPVSDYFNSLQPSIDFTLEIKSYCNYLIATEPVPLQTIRTSFCRCGRGAGLVLRCGSSIKASFTNLRAWGATEVPVIASVILHAIRLPAGLYGTCTGEQAAALMRELAHGA